jgi:NADPH-dependent glutamate synthase beta subunit-like oxidoreductase
VADVTRPGALPGRLSDRNGRAVHIAYIWEGKIEQAFEAITATNPFSSICGRVCDAPCEPACRRTDSDGPLAIRNLKRFVMEKLGKSHHLPPVAVTRKETVAIVGSGPAGMTAAQDLAEAGFEVHVYEMMDRLGGMMTWGIPAFRLPPGIIDEDMQRILRRCPGIKAHLNCALGKDVTLDELKARHAAVLLTIGSWWGKSMGIPGDDHPQVVDGVGFLRRVNDGERPTLPETVLVIGGGDVAMDACRVAKRLPGCENVKVIYRRGPGEIPARKDELHGAIKEGIEFVYNTQPVRVMASRNSFALRCVETSLGEPGIDGRRRPVEVPGSERDIDCGMVIMAVGQKGASEELDKHGLMDGDRVRTEWKSMRTKDPKVFAAGDGAFGGSTIVKAMFHGHRAAYYVKAFLYGIVDPLPYRTPYRTRRVPVAQDINWEVFPRQEQTFHGLGENPIAFPEIESTYDEKTAKDEAARCYRCDAETGSHDYSVRTREDIFVMARTRPDDAVTQKAIFKKRLEQRPNPYPEGHKPSLDDLVFLAANLSRLVIDPYRDACNMKSSIGGSVSLELPFLVTGFDDVSSELKGALGQALAKTGSGYVGRTALPGDAPWLQLVVAGQNAADPEAAGHVHLLPAGYSPSGEARVAGAYRSGAVDWGAIALIGFRPAAAEPRRDPGRGRSWRRRRTSRSWRRHPHPPPPQPRGGPGAAVLRRRPLRHRRREAGFARRQCGRDWCLHGARPRRRDHGHGHPLLRGPQRGRPGRRRGLPIAGAVGRSLDHGPLHRQDRRPQPRARGPAGDHPTDSGGDRRPARRRSQAAGARWKQGS